MRAAIRNPLSAVSFCGEMRLVAALLFVFVGCSRATNDELEARNATIAFYDVYMKLRPSGVPPEDQQLQLKKVISAGLADLLHKASVAEGNDSKETKDGVPPRIEGDLFTSLDQGAVSYKVLQCERQKESSTCIVELANIDDRDNSEFTWKDRVFVVREGNRLVVDDIEYLGERQFMHKGRLKDILSKVVEERKKGAS